MNNITKQSYRSLCPISTMLDICGDKWTLIILRDMVNGKCRYNDFLTSPEKITTNILASRLSNMQKHGLISKQAYQPRPRRYEYYLTPKGRELMPVLIEICKWSARHYPDCWVPPEKFITAKV